MDGYVGWELRCTLFLQARHKLNTSYNGFMQRILLVEDEAAIREAEAAYLRSAGYQVLEVADGAAALQAFDRVAPHAVVLDLSLPRVDGLDVCRTLRRSSQVPIMMVTARTSEIDELLGLEIGADDYLKSPSIHACWLRASRRCCAAWARVRSRLGRLWSSPTSCWCSKLPSRSR